VTADNRPAVERRHPPTALVRLVNPLVRRLVRRGVAADQLLVLHYVGRRSGRRYDVPAGYHVIGDVPTVLTNSPWRRNFAGGRRIEVTYRGARRAAEATLVEEVETVTQVYADLFDVMGWKAAQRRLGLRVNVNRAPTRGEIARAVRDSGLSLVRLDGLAEHLGRD
jgi:hypothetical protein